MSVARVRRPVIIVRCATVVRFAIGKLATYTYYKYGARLFTEKVLAFLVALVGILCQQFFAVDKVYLAWQTRFQLQIISRN